MKKTRAREELTNFAIDGFLSTISIASATALLSGDSALPQAALWGFGGIAAATVISRRWPWRSSSSSIPQWSRAFQSLAPLPGGGYNMEWYDRREQEPEEFVFFGLGLSVPISESTLHRFVSIARRRQLNASYDTKYSLLQSGNNFRRLKRNWVLSEAHFTKRVSPRFGKDEYKDCLRVLGYTRLMFARGNGSSGRLFGDVGQWSTEHYIRIAKQRWLSPPLLRSPASSPNLIKKIVNLRN